MSAFWSTPLVVDTGSYELRCGLADCASPRVRCRTFLVKQQDNTLTLDSDIYHKYIGSVEDVKTRDLSCLSEVEQTAYPELISAAFRGLLRRPVCRSAEDHPLFVVMPDWAIDAPGVRSAVMQVALEDFKAPAAFLGREAVCSVLEAGLPTALCASIGHRATNFRVVVDGYVLRSAGQASVPGGGCAVTETLSQALADACSFRQTVAGSQTSSSCSPSFIEQAVLLLMDEVKRVCCEVSPIPSSVLRRTTRPAATANDTTSPVSDSFVAPDGSILDLSHIDRTAAYNVLFSGERSIAQRLVDVKASVIHYTEVHARLPTLVTGGTAKAKGLPERLHAELKQLDRTFTQHQLAVSKDPSVAAWRGAAVIACAKPFDGMWISRALWEEEGESCLASRIN